MKKKILLLLALFTTLYPVTVFADTSYVHNQPTKDKTKEIELSVEADDLIIDEKDIEFAWSFMDSAGNETNIQTENSVLDNNDNRYWAKGDSQGKSTLTISYTKYGNGTYIVRARDTLHNVSEPKKIEINGWDTTAPTAKGLTIDKTNLVKESVVTLEGAADNIVLADKPYILSEITGWNGTGNTYTKKNSKAAVTGNEFTITKNGDYCITLTDYAGNIKDFPFRIDNIDRAIPVISSIEYSNNSGAINVTVNASDNSGEEPLSNYSHGLKYLIADTPDDIEKAAISSWNSSNVLNNKLGGDLATSGIASYYVGVIDEAGNYAIVPFTINADLVLGKLGTMTKDNLTSYITLTPSGRWTNGDVVCRVDIPSGTFADDVEYKFNSNAYQTSNKKTFTGNGTVTVTVKDKYGNEYVSNTLTIDNIDKTKPTITVTPNSSENRATIEVSDADSKVSKVTIKGTGYLQETTIKDYQTSVASNSFVYDIHSKGSYTFTVYDEAGNKTEKILEVSGSITDNEDLINGLVKNRMTHVPSGWTNTDVELRVALTSEESLDPLPFSWDGGAYGTSKAITVTENGTHTLTVKDMYGNTYASGDYAIGNIDKTKPTISVAFTSEDKNTFKITCLDESSGLLKVTMTGEDNVEHTIKDFLTSAPTTEQTFTNKVPKNGNYTFTAYDLAGNTETFDISVDNAQITNALLDPDSIVSYVTHTPTNWTNGDVTLRLNMPSLEGLAAEPYKWNTSSYKATSDVVVTCNGDYFVTVKDEYGYEHPSDNYHISNIDKIAPTVNSSVNANGNVITLDIIDEDSAIYGASGLSLVTVTSVKNPTEVTVKDYLVSATEDTVDYVLSVDDTYTFHIYDRAGNVTEEVVTVTGGKVDNTELTPSELKAKLSHTPTKWINEDATIRLSLVSEEGLAEMPYKWSPDGEFSNSRTAIVHENGNYKVWVKDTFGNVIESDAYVIGNIDKVAPTIETALDERNNTVTITVADELSGISKVTVSDMSGTEHTIKDYYATEPKSDTFDWEVPYKANFTFKVYDNAGNWNYVQRNIIDSITDNEDLTDTGIASHLTHTPTEWTNKPVTLQINLPSFENLNPIAPFKWDDNAYSNSKTYVVNEIGSYILTIKDKYGNEISSLPHEVANIDHINPTLAVAFNDEQNTATITVEEIADSNGASSGLDKITVTTEGAETTIKTYLTDTKSDIYNYTIPKNGKYIFKVYDRAGNVVTSEEYEILNARTGSDVLTTTGIRAAITQNPYADVYTNDSVTLTLILNGETGLAEVPYRWNGGDFTNVPSYTVTENGVYPIDVKDKYGNIIRSSYEVRNIDKNNPSITVKAVDKGRFIEITANDEILGSALGKVVIEGGELTESKVVKDYTDTIYTDTFRIETPSKGSFNLTVYDKAGNSSSAGIEIEDIITDNSELTVENITASIQSMQTEWTNSVVPLKLVLRNLDNLADEPYNWSDGVSETGFSTDNTYNVDKNGLYFVTVKDKYGNTFTSEGYEVDNIDHVVPEISYSLNDAQTVMTLNVSDVGSGVSKIAWQGDAFTGLVSIKEYLQPVEYEQGIEVAIPTNGNYVVTVYDSAGNTSTVDVKITDIKSQNPLLTPLGIYGSMKTYPSTWTNGDVVVTAELLNKENVLTDGYYWESDCDIGVDSIADEWTTHTSFTATSNGFITLSVKDEFGTLESVHVSLPYAIENIDKTLPTISMQLLEDGTVDINVADEMSDKYGASGIKEISVVDPNGTMTILKRNSVGILQDTVNYAMFLQGQYTFRVEDHAGNIAEDYLVVNNDGVATSNTWLAQGPDALTNCLNFTPTGYTKGSVMVTLAPTDTTNFATKPYKFGDDEWQSENYSVYTENCSFTVKVRDVNGVIYESGLIEINNIDNISPNIASLTADNITDNMAQITISANDACSGVSMINIIGDEIPNETIIQKYDSGIQSVNCSYNVKKNGIYRIRVYDVTGNVTEGVVTVSGIIDVKNQSMNNTVNSTQSSNYSVTKPRTTTTNTPSKAVSRTVAAPAEKTTGTTQNNFFSAITDKISNVKEESKQVDVVPNIKVENTAENKVETTEEAKVEKANTVKVSPVVTTSTTTKLVQTSSDSPEDIVVMHRDSQSAQEVVSNTDNKKGANIILGLLVGLVAFSAIVFGIRYYYIKKSS